MAVRVVGERIMERWMANNSRMNEMGVFMQLFYDTLKWKQTDTQIGGENLEYGSPSDKHLHLMLFQKRP